MDLNVSLQIRQIQQKSGKEAKPMRINSQSPMANSPREPQKISGGQGGQFQTELSAHAAPQAARDTFTYAAPTVPTDVTILPTESTEVKLNKLRQIGGATDYTGMSYTEIYTAIWDRYNDAFDGKMGAITSCLIASEEWCNIHNQFSTEVCRMVYNPAAADEKKGLYTGPVNIHSEMMGYGGMSWQEKEAAIKEKYKGKDTLEDFLNMQGELFRSGAMYEKMGNDSASLYRSILGDKITRFVFPDEFLRTGVAEQSSIDATLDTHFDQKAFYEEMKVSLDNMTFPPSRINLRTLIANEADEALSAFSLDASSAVANQVDKFLSALEKNDESN